MPSWSLTRRWNRSWFGILSFMLMALPASAQQPAGLEPDQSGSGLSGHWSFQRFMRPVAPKVNDQGWVQTPVDAFVLARLEEQGLRPSPPADKHTLIRRVWLDLLGLPPTQQDVAEFLADDRHDAYERLVDRLLASEHY